MSPISEVVARRPRDVRPLRGHAADQAQKLSPPHSHRLNTIIFSTVISRAV
jgi:hypothetical protein